MCLAFAQALSRFGVPGEVITDNGKQFTDRFGKGGEVMFDRICRKNGIKHRLTQPASPNQNGKVERFHGTLRPDFFDTAGPFTSVAEAQTALDVWVVEYNTDRPHQALDAKVPVVPADRFEAVPDEQRELLPLWVPPTLMTNPEPSARPDGDDDHLDDHLDDHRAGATRSWSGGPITFDAVVPPSGNMSFVKRQFWLGPARAGLTVSVWADLRVIHLSIAGARVKSVTSHLSVADLNRLVGAGGARPAGEPPIPTRPDSLADGEAVEVDRVISPGATFALAGRVLTASTLLAGRQVGIRIEPAVLMLFDLDTRQLLRTMANPFTAEQILRVRGLRPAGPPPRPSMEPVTVQRLADGTGVISVARQRIGLGRVHARRTLTVHVSDTTITVELGDGHTHRPRRRQPSQQLQPDPSRTPPRMLAADLRHTRLDQTIDLVRTRLRPMRPVR